MSSTHFLDLLMLFMDDDAIVLAGGQDGKICNPWGSQAPALSPFDALSARSRSTACSRSRISFGPA
jgi:hypothetical protein